MIQRRGDEDLEWKRRGSPNLTASLAKQQSKKEAAAVMPSAADSATSCAHNPKQAVVTVKGRLNKVQTVSSTLLRTLDCKDPTDAKSINSEPTVRGPTTMLAHTERVKPTMAQEQGQYGPQQRSSMKPRYAAWASNRQTWFQVRYLHVFGAWASSYEQAPQPPPSVVPQAAAFSGLFDEQFKMEKRRGYPPGQGQGRS
ncbi:hypothetical protein CSAL01_05916 [Colletotrichum salicis]|uniref:Uncharacterized protein n=1 Tax=Colletotrichum salicis TaxID=1209931 RepID=A0A135SAQ4_9PEZI|nr:hypothetical protein CSAL01_05916 [Colletotrichum salicis]